MNHFRVSLELLGEFDIWQVHCYPNVNDVDSPKHECQDDGDMKCNT